MRDANVASHRILIGKEFLSEFSIHDRHRNGIAVIGKREFAAFAQGNLRHAEVTGAHREVSGLRLLLGLGDWAAFDRNPRLGRERVRQVSRDRR